MNFNGAGTSLEGVFGAVIEATALGSILIVLVAVVQWVAGKRLGPSWRFALWGIVLVRLLAPIAPESRWSVFNAAQWIAKEKAAPVVTMEVEPATLVVPEMAGEAVEVGFPAEAPAFASEAQVESPLPWRMIAMSVWSVGVIWFLGRLMVGSWWLRRKIRGDVRGAGQDAKRRDLDAALESAAVEMRMRRRFRIVETAMVSSPALFGMWRPQLLVPRGFAEQLNARELRHVMLHELAHVKRWDLITNWLMAVAQAVHWFNPLVWLALRQMRVERELACDEMVLRITNEDGEEEGRAYGETILRLLEGVKSRPSLPALVGIAEEKHSARKRILQIVSFDKRRRGLRALGALLVAALAIGGLTNAQIKEAESEAGADTANTADRESENQPSLNEAGELKDKSERESQRERVVTEKAKHHSAVVNGARVLMERGQLDEAEVKLQEVLKADPEHRAAKYYSTLLQERRGRHEVLKEEGQEQERARLLPPGRRVKPDIIQIAERTQTGHSNLPGDRLSTAEEAETEAALIEALKLNPEDRGSAELLATLREKRFAAEVRKREGTVTDPARLYQSRRPGGDGRQKIIRKLNEMVIDHYEVPNELKLSEVIQDIHRLALKLDPEKVGVNFVFSSHVEVPGNIESKASPNPIIPFAEQPPAPLKLMERFAINSPALKVNDYVVKISPALRNVTMLGLINAIVEVAEPPKGNEGGPRLRYSVEDYAIVFGLRLREAEPLYTRTFKTDPNTFLQGLQPVVDINPVLQGNGAERGARVQEAVKEFFTEAGINFGALKEFNAQAGGTPPPQKAIFYNDRTRVLMTRLTKGELDIVEKALQTMQGADAEQLVMEVSVVEVKSREELSKLIGMMNIAGEFRTTLTTTEFRRVERAATNGGFNWLKMPRMTTLNGRPARISKKEELKLSVDVTCKYRESDKTFQVAASSTDPKNGRSETKSGVVYDRQTFVLMPDMEGGVLKPARVVFITPSLIDAAGNLKNKDDEELIDLIGREVP